MKAAVGLVDNPEDVQATDCTSILSGLALGAVEVNGDGDNGVGDRVAEVRLCGLPHLGQDHEGDFLGGLKTKLETGPSLVAKLSDSQIPCPHHGTGP